MKPESRHIIHMGINFIMSPKPAINQEAHLAFQKHLASCSVNFTNTRFEDGKILVQRDPPQKLSITVIAHPDPIGQLLIVGPNPNHPLESFIQETEQIVEAFEATWPEPNRQIFKRDATIRDLYQTTEEHAFKEIWEKKLGQSESTLSQLDRLVLGGGLRFVMPPNEQGKALIEVKIESYLNDSAMIFIETQFTWNAPLPAGKPFEPRIWLKDVDGYINNSVIPFFQGGK